MYLVIALACKYPHPFRSLKYAQLINIARQFGYHKIKPSPRALTRCTLHHIYTHQSVAPSHAPVRPFAFAMSTRQHCTHMPIASSQTHRDFPAFDARQSSARSRNFAMYILHHRHGFSARNTASHSPIVTVPPFASRPPHRFYSASRVIGTYPLEDAVISSGITLS